MAKRSEPLEQRFWRHVEPELNTGCWLWAGTVRRGYGTFKVYPRKYGAHRYAWEITHGYIPSGMVVCHRCDTPACVNPGHLFLGTHSDNAWDKTRKGRGPDNRGERHGMSRLTADDVLAIRARVAAGERQRDIAGSLGLTQSCISRIAAGRSWSHVCEASND